MHLLPWLVLLLFFPSPDLIFSGRCPLGVSPPLKRFSIWLGVSYRHSDFPNPSLPRDRVFKWLRRHAFAISHYPPRFHGHLRASTADAAPMRVFNCAHRSRALNYRFPTALPRRYANFRVISPISPSTTIPFCDRSFMFESGCVHQ